MRCPRCGQETDRVIDSRAVRDGKGVRRRRECASCGHRYTTYEYVDAVTLLVVKRDGRREPYQRDKARRGVLQACRKRPIGAEQIEALIDRVESQLQRLGGQEVEAREIGRLLMAELRELDPVAYVRFASIYRRFDSVDAFIEIVEGMARPGIPGSGAGGSAVGSAVGSGRGGGGGAGGAGGAGDGADGTRSGPGGPRDGAAPGTGQVPRGGANPVA